MTADETRVLDLILSELRGVRTEVNAHGQAIARLEERVANAVEDISDQREETKSLWEKVYPHSALAGVVLLFLDQYVRGGRP